MAAKSRKDQQKKERHAAKRKEKHRQLVRQKNMGLGERLIMAAKSPVFYSWATTNLWDDGIGQVVISRLLPNGFVAFSNFLVDRYCLGVKDAFANIAPRSNYEEKVERNIRSQFEVKPLTPQTARHFVESAVEYARSLGILPHPDYQKARLIFGDINAADTDEELEFGQDGKPYFYAGPYDGPERCRQILKLLQSHCGEGNFHYTLPLDLGSQVRFPGIDSGSIRMFSSEDEEMMDEEDGPLIEGTISPPEANVSQ